MRSLSPDAAAPAAETPWSVQEGESRAEGQRQRQPRRFARLARQILPLGPGRLAPD
jgi:hypothetical protein